ncbi:hypothetical protein ACS0TY_021275 [Phlomoides rotata]
MTKSQPNLTLDSRNMMTQFLLANSTNGSVHHGKIKEASISYGVCRRTIQYIWTTAKQQVSLGIPINLTCKMKGKPKKKHIQLDIEAMKAIAFEKRSRIMRLARELNMNKSHVGRWVQEGAIKPHTNQIKPELTLTNKLQRLKFSLNAIVLDMDANQLEFSLGSRDMDKSNSPYNHA